MKKNELRIINALLTLSRTRLPLHDALSKINQTLARLAMAETVALYLEKTPGGELVLASEVSAPGATGAPAAFARESPVGALLSGPKEPRKAELPGEFHDAWSKYGTAVFIPLSLEWKNGLYIFLSRRLERLGALSLSFFSILGETLGVVIEDLAITHALETKLRELRALNVISRTTYATLEPAELLPQVARHMVEALEVEACCITIERGAGVSAGGLSRFCWPPSAMGLGCLESVTTKVREHGSTEHDIPCPGPPGRGPLLASGFPLVCRQEFAGTAAVLHSRPMKEREELLLGEDGPAFLEALAAQVSMVLAGSLNFAESVRLSRENEERARELSILFEISQALPGTMRPDDVLRIILTAATYGHGLGFNRAALYLVNEKTDTLQGMLGVGPENAQEAARVWQDLTSRNLPLADVLRISRKAQTDNAFNAAVKSVRLPIARDAGILALSVLEKRAFNIPDAAADPRVNRSVTDRLGSHSFAVAPLLAEGRVLGVLAVDNLYNNRPITERDLQLLTTFATQAATALHNAQLYARLEKANLELKRIYRRVTQTERLAALGEMAATVAHEVRNPLVSVGGFARRLERRMDRNDPNRRYAGIILKEITRLERFLNEILALSREQPLSLSQVDLNRLIAEVGDLFREDLAVKGIRLELELAENLPLIEADPEQVSQILMNLFSNSLEALADRGVITIRTFIPDRPSEVGFSFADTGGGVPESLITEIFKPFFTTKGRGTGLGLALVQKMIRSHQGSIETRNKPGESLTFIVRLPLKPERAPEKPETKEETP